MVVIGFTLLGVGLVVGLLLALADPVLLSRINGEAVQDGGSGRHLDPRPVPPARVAGEGSTVVRLDGRARGDRPSPRAA
jgi:hypothetical protein